MLDEHKAERHCRASGLGIGSSDVLSLHGWRRGVSDRVERLLGAWQQRDGQVVERHLFGLVALCLPQTGSLARLVQV